jgi:hypothetical protein
MALFPRRLKSGYISVLIGNGATPEVFTKVCGATQRSFTDQKNTTDDVLDPCDDPEAIPYRVLQVTGRQASIALDIVYNRTQAPLFRSLMASSESSNMRFEFTEPTGDVTDGGYYQGAFQVTNFQVTAGGNAEYATGSLQIESDGEYDWVDVP